MDENTLRERFIQISRSLLGSDITEEISAGETDMQRFFKTIVKKCYENNKCLSAEIYVEMVDLKLHFYKVAWKHSKELLDDAVLGYSIDLLQWSFVLCFKPDRTLVEKLLTIDLESNFSTDELVLGGWFYFRNLNYKAKFKKIIEKSQKVWNILYESQLSPCDKVSKLNDLGIILDKLVSTGRYYLLECNKYKDLLKLCSQPYA